LFYSSDYFDRLYEYAIELIKKGKAYVCDLSADEIREYRGTLTAPGKESPYRDRSQEESLDLLERMKAGEFEDGTRVLRAKIDMASPNLSLRDPALYRIRKAHHHRTGDDWCIYPMYDFTHCLSDSIEGITHSICTLEFENNRPLYDWILDVLGVHHPQQIEFARLNLGNTVLSKRKLLKLVDAKYVDGWDDPRMPTISGLRRRGYTSRAIREFCGRIGVAKLNSIIDMVVLENCIREELNKSAQRVMAVLDPVKVVITNYPLDQEEELDAINNPEDLDAGSRKVPFSRELYIERSDFQEDPPKKFFRLAPGREVRLRYAYFITCEKIVKDEKNGEIKEIHCTYDPATKGGDSPDGRKVKGTLHWVSAKHAYETEVRLYDYLFVKRNPEETTEDGDFLENLNPDSVKVIPRAKIEPFAKNTSPGTRCQFERLGYFFSDPKDSTEGNPVFNRISSLKDTWKKINAAEKK